MKIKMLELHELRLEYLHQSNILEEIWTYHPSNPDFVNPIRAYEEIKNKLHDLEHKINSLEREINSLN
jgi:hypothetical protein